MSTACEILVEKPECIDHFGELGIDVRGILKLIL
jgi:hypothetical protein